MIDLRSDTVTRPNPAMRAAMADAEVGDDVYGEDPTVRRLEEAAAARFGRQAALYCPSGVMCNQLWLRVLAPGGTEAIVEDNAHVVNYEAGAGALLGHVQFRTVPGSRGVLDPEVVAAAIRPDVFPLTPTSLVCVEQTHNRRGGAVTPLETLDRLRRLTDEAGVALYLDGARVFNAAVAAGVDVADYAALVDGLSFCTSKALSAPVGSAMVGDADAIVEARRWRRRYGGGMRQAGVIAAASLVALEQMTDRLVEDHAHARLLADAVAEVYPEGLEAGTVETNIVCIENVDAAALVEALADRGVRAGALGPSTARLVTHPDVTEDDCRRAAAALKDALADVAR
ncbi:GntG family PLP-dependent aldolase [Egibacter rhizosphaerae]|uniref:GntG family PLP-dependent aldolase n=1 Tax=Egibacter rhizosphaerae TaxID=1670831 RepID=UPI00197AF104|nr:GntG family PLP-dependent aldolase [Egibacter rhizosphaerae]